VLWQEPDAAEAAADTRTREEGAVKNLAAALVAAQAEMPGVKPDAKNPHFKSEFVSLGHLINATRPVLSRHGLSITQWVTHGGTESLPMLRTVLMHTSGEFMESTMPLLVGKNDMQGLGGAITYARRYAWTAALGISDDDDDGNQASTSAATNGRSKVAPPATTGSQAGGDAQPSPPPPSTLLSPREALVAELEALAVAWKALKPDWNEGELTKWLGAKPRSEGELTAAIDTYTANIAAAKAEAKFPIPETAKGKAA
jgi:hypothetical protein